MRRLIWPLLALFLLTSCRMPATGLVPAEPEATVTAKAGKFPPLKGRAFFPEERTTQYALPDVVSNSTCTLLNPESGTPLYTQLTQSTGEFTLNPTDIPNLAVGSAYVIEVTRGLSNSKPGNEAPRVRTMVLLKQEGWVSLSSSTPGDPVFLSVSTTALSIAVAFRRAAGDVVSAQDYMGALTFNSTKPDVYVSHGAVTLDDYNTVLQLVRQAFVANQDPVACVGYKTSSPRFWFPARDQLFIAQMSATSGTVGQKVSFYGSGFDANSANDTVVFGGMPTTAQTADTSHIEVVIPPGAQSGYLMFRVRNILVIHAYFTVNPVVNGAPDPDHGAPGTVVKLNGTGFNMAALAANILLFGPDEATATVTAVTANSLTATVPTLATTGPIKLVIATQSLTVTDRFVIPVAVTDLSARAAVPGDRLVIMGTGFSPRPGSNTVRFNGTAAVILSATTTALVVQVPVTTSGDLHVLVGTQDVNAGAFTIGGMRVSAVSPSVLEPGGTLSLEGNFGSSAIVSFQGGVTANATVLGPNRAIVSIPAQAQSGDVTVLTSATMSNAVPIAVTQAPLGLQAFGPVGVFNDSRVYASSIHLAHHLYVLGGFALGGGPLRDAVSAPVQADGTVGEPVPQTSNNLKVARGMSAAVTVGNRLYILGGTDGLDLAGLSPTSPLPAVDTALVSGAGVLGTLDAGPPLTRGRAAPAAVVTGGYVYVLGGRSDTAPLATIERARIQPDGSLGAFELTSNVLASARWGHAAVVVGRYVYVAGGFGMAEPQASVERAPINPDGSLGPFSLLNDVTLVTPRGGLTLVATQTQLIALAGRNSTAPLLSAETAPVLPDGTVGAFRESATHPSIGRIGHVALVAGTNLVLFGGKGSGNQQTIERASLVEATGMSNFQLAGAGLRAARSYAATQLVGDRLFVFGGRVGARATDSYEVAVVRPDGSLGAFSMGTTRMTTPRSHFGCALANGYVYVVGGADASGAPLATLERAKVNPNGTLAAFEVMGQQLLPARMAHTVSMIGNQLYVIGGYNAGQGGYLDGLQRLPFDASGTPGSFQSAGTLPERRGLHAAVLAGAKLYLFGGAGNAGLLGPIRSSVDGSTLNFQAYGLSQVSGWQGLAAALFGGRAVLLGGGMDPQGVEVAPVFGDGTMGGFDRSASLRLNESRIGAVCQVVGTSLYVLGGGSSSVERSVLQ